VRHHEKVPFRLLEEVPALSCSVRAEPVEARPSTSAEPAPDLIRGRTEEGSGNLIVEGDNLLALKALLPHYAGQVKCIYIDPPYNTGNESWVYNDNVNSPEMRDWLGKVVGKEAEDLSRHDKWLCMMYPRLVLLKQFLREDGVLLVSLDGNEHRYAELLLDEIFGSTNRVETLIWKKSYGGGAKSKQIVNLHEYILCFAKNKNAVGEIELPPDEKTLRYYKFSDAKFEGRGPYRLQPLATNSMDSRPNLRYAIPFKGEEIWPEKQWQWSKDRALVALADDELVIRKVRDAWSVNYKQYLKNPDGEERASKLYSIVEGIYTQQGTNEVKDLFGDGKAFSFPKPPALVQLLVQAFTNADSLVLDSFAGSGTTAQAVLKQNTEDGGSRRAILVEMDPKIAREITAERVRRVAMSYRKPNGDEVAGLGGGFRYCTLGKPLFDARGHINPEVRFGELAHFVWFMETGTPLPDPHPNPSPGGRGAKTLSPLLGVHHGRAVYLLYNGIHKDRSSGGGNVLTSPLLAELPAHDGPKVIYGTRCLISADRQRRLGIVFKQLPYELKVAR
jgi:adenine-specific DNA-methyltransferase